MNKEAYRKLQKISGQKSRNNFVGILDETDFLLGHFEINWPLHKFDSPQGPQLFSLYWGQRLSYFFLGKWVGQPVQHISSSSSLAQIGTDKRES